MAIRLKDAAVEQALRELSRETGESLTFAAGVAFRERLARCDASQSSSARCMRWWS